MKVRTLLTTVFVLALVSPALSATEYLDPISDDQANWGCTGCSGGHYTVLDDGIRQQNGNPSTTGDYISDAANNGAIDIHNANSTDYIDFNYVTLWVYADTKTQNFQLNATLRNSSNIVATNSFTGQGTGWYSVNWTTPSAGAGNFDARFQSNKNGGGQSETGIVYSWYVEVAGTPPDTQAPRWRNQQQNESQIFRQEQIELKAQGKDKNLDSAILATNETGTWENKSGVYGSPTTLADSGNYEWSNFTWRNTSFIEGTVGWKIYYNDTFGQYNVTETQTFDMVKRPSDTFLELNGTRSDTTYQENELANFTVTTNVSGRNVELKTNYSDGVWKTWDSGTEPLENLTKLHSVGYYEWQGNFPGDSDYRPSSETFYTTVQGPKPVVNDVQNTPQEVEPGDSIDEINVTIKNKGVDPAVGVNATLQLLYPDGTLVTAWGPQNEENTSCGTIDAGAKCSVTYTDYTVSQDEDVGGSYTERVELDWTAGNRQNKDFSLPVKYLPDNVSTTLEPQSVAPGNGANYSFNLTNPFSSDLTNVDITPSCPSADVSCTCESNDCSLGTISSGEEKSKQINVDTTDSIAADSYNVSALFNYTNPNGNTYERGPTGNKSLQVTVLTVDSLFPQEGLKVNTSSGSYIVAEVDVFNKTGKIKSGLSFNVNLTRGSTNKSATINSKDYIDSEGYWELNFTVPSLSGGNYYDFIVGADNGQTVKRDTEQDAIYTGNDLFPPTYRNVVGDDKIGEFTTNNLGAEVRDAGGLERAFLATNETGTMKNYSIKNVQATYNSNLGAPECNGELIGTCVANSSLLKSRDSITGQNEPNSPNTLDGSTDGTSGDYQADPSFENVTITAYDGGEFNAGERVNLTMWTFCNSGGVGNDLVVFSTTSVSSPSFTREYGTTEGSCSSTFRKFTATITLPDQKGTQALRFKYNVSSASGYTDYDDVVFPVSGPSGKRELRFDGSEDWRDAKFEWMNNSKTSGSAVNWRVWFEDEEGNYNSTDMRSFGIFDEEPTKLTFDTFNGIGYSSEQRFYNTEGVLPSSLYINSSVTNQKSNPFSFKDITAVLDNLDSNERTVIEDWDAFTGGNYNSSYGLSALEGGVYNLTVNASNFVGEVRNSTLIHVYPDEGVSAYKLNEEGETERTRTVIENRRILAVINDSSQKVRFYNKAADLFFNFTGIGISEDTRGRLNFEGKPLEGSDNILQENGERLSKATLQRRTPGRGTNRDWWNTDYKYRREIEISEPTGLQRTGEVVRAKFDFDVSVGNCRDQTRVVEYQGAGSWKEVASQIVSQKSSNGKCRQEEVAFPVNVSANSNSTYYVYYGNDNPTTPSYGDPFGVDTSGSYNYYNNSEVEIGVSDGSSNNGFGSIVRYYYDTDIGLGTNLAFYTTNGCGRGANAQFHYTNLADSDYKFSGCNTGTGPVTFEILDRGPVLMDVRVQKDNYEDTQADFYTNYTFTRGSDVIDLDIYYDEVKDVAADRGAQTQHCVELGDSPFYSEEFSYGVWNNGSSGTYFGLEANTTKWRIQSVGNNKDTCGEGINTKGDVPSQEGEQHIMFAQSEVGIENRIKKAANPVNHSKGDLETVYSVKTNLSIKSENSDFLTYDISNFSEGNGADRLSTTLGGRLGDNIDDERYHTSSGQDAAVTSLSSGIWTNFTPQQSNYSLVYDDATAGDAPDNSLFSWIRFSSSPSVELNSTGVWYDGSNTGTRIRYNTSNVDSSSSIEYLLSFTTGDFTSIEQWQQSVGRDRKPEIAFSIDPVETNLSVVDTNSNLFADAVTQIKNFRGEVRAENILSGSTSQSTALVSKNFNNSLRVKAPVLGTNLSAEIRDLNTTEPISLEPQIVEDYTFNEFYIENAKSVVAINDTGLQYKKTTLVLPKDGSAPNQIAHCKDWSKSTASCNDWEFNSTKDYNAVENSTHIKFNVSTFDAYTNTEVARIHVNLTEPPGAFSVVQNDTFALNATATCKNADCGNITAAAHYNASGSEPETLIPETGDIFQNDFKVNSTPNPKICNGDLKEGETCKVSWDVNATGNISTTRKFDVNFTSNVSIPENDTENVEGDIIRGIFEVNVTFDKISFGALDPATYNNPAVNNSDRLYNFTITDNNTGERSLWINGSNLQQEDGSDEIPISELSASVENDSATGTPIKQNYTLLDTPIEPNTTVTSYYWINVSGIYADNYSGEIRVKVNQTS